MSTKQNLKQCLEVNIVALNHDGTVADADLSVKQFLDYMSSLTEKDCNEIKTFTVTMLSVSWTDKYMPSEASKPALLQH